MSKVAARKKFQVGGVEKELFMSFSIHQKLITLCGGMDEIGNSFLDPIRQLEIVVLLVLGRDCPVCKTVDDLHDALDNLELGADEAVAILDWAQSFLVDFTFAQIKSLSEKYQEEAKKVPQSLAQALPHTLTGSET